jgi:hypothetical protein
MCSRSCASLKSARRPRPTGARLARLVGSRGERELSQLIPCQRKVGDLSERFKLLRIEHDGMEAEKRELNKEVSGKNRD